MAIFSILFPRILGPVSSAETRSPATTPSRYSYISENSAFYPHYQALCELCWKVKIQSLLFAHILFNLPYHPPELMRKQIKEVEDFGVKVAGCDLSSSARQQLLAAFQQLSMDAREMFASIDIAKLEEFVNQQDERRTAFLKRRFHTECKYVISMQSAFLPISVWVARLNGNDASSENGKKIQEITKSNCVEFFNQRTKRIAPPANEPSVVNISQISALHRQRGREIEGMEKCVQITTLQEYTCVISQELAKIPIMLHEPIPTSSPPHLVDFSQLNLLMNQFNNCPTCRRGLLAKERLPLHVERQKEVSRILAQAIISQPDEETITCLRTALAEITENDQIATDQENRVLSELTALTRLAMLIRDLPDNIVVNGRSENIYERVKKLFIQAFFSDSN